MRESFSFSFKSCICVGGSPVKRYGKKCTRTSMTVTFIIYYLTEGRSILCVLFVLNYRLYMGFQNQTILFRTAVYI